MCCAETGTLRGKDQYIYYSRNYGGSLKLWVLDLEIRRNKMQDCVAPNVKKNEKI